MNNTIRTLIASASLGTFLLLAACGGQDADELMSGARSSLIKSDTKTAIIQLKGVLQRHPESPEARFLLGKALLEIGDAAAANVELRKAYDLKYPAAQVVPLLAQAMLAVQQNQKLIDEFAMLNLIEPKAVADLKTSVAAAYVSVKRADMAQEAIRAAFEAVPDHPATLQLQARMHADANSYGQALVLIEKVVAAWPSNASVWQQKGDYLFLGKGDLKGAMDAYQKALDIKPNHIASRSNLIALLLVKGDLKAAAEQVELLRKFFPNNPQTTFFEAQLAHANNQPKKALELIERVLKVEPDNIKVLQSAGEIELANGAYLQAERSLTRALALAPSLVTTRLQLSRTYILLDQPARGLTTLEPLLLGPNPDARAHALAGDAHLRSGNLEQAANSFSSAVKLDPQNSGAKIYLALSKMNSAGVASTIGELQRIAKADKGAYADLALVGLHLRGKEFAKALQAVDAIEAKEPNNPMTANLRGRVQLLSGDVAGARISFERALALDPLLGPPAASLATLDLEDNRPDSAQRRFDAILAVDPNNVQALLAIVKIRTFEGVAMEEVTRLLDNAIKLNPSEEQPRLLLVNHHLAQRNFKFALTAAQDAMAAIPSSVELLDALGRARMINGDANQALVAFNKLASLEPKSPRPYVRLSSVHLSMRQKVAAEQALRRALTLAPNYLEAQQALIEILLADKRAQDARKIAKKVQEQRPHASVGFMMEGSIDLWQNDLKGAIDVYRAGLKKVPATEIAVKLHSTLIASKQNADAEKLAATWANDHPMDAEFAAYLGDLALAKGDLDSAEKQYRAVIAIRPNDAAAQNNVAWAMVQAHKPGAIPYAEQAVTLRPGTPGLMDTLAMALAAEKKFDRAIEIQKKAMALAPSNNALRLNLARLHIAAGDKASARAQLQALAELGNKFSAQSEVSRLLKSL